MKKWIGLVTLCVALVFGVYANSEGAYRVKNSGQIIVTKYATINAAVAAAGTNKETLVVDGSDTLAANLTIPSTLTLKIPQGGMIVKASTYTLVINGPTEIGLYQVFSGFDVGDVTFGAGAVKEVYLEWWQINTTPGTTNMTLAFQSAIYTRMPVTLEASRYYVTDSLTLNPNGVPYFYAGLIKGAGKVYGSAVLDGSNILGTVIVTPADFNKPLFYLITSRDLSFRDFTVLGPGKGYSGSIAFQFDGYNSVVRMDSVGIIGWETGIQTGHYAAEGYGVQGNDDDMTFFDMYINQTTYCVRTYNSQSYMLDFYGCTFGPQTDYTLKCEATGPYQGGKIQIYGGWIASAVKVFDAQSSYGTIVVIGAHFESVQVPPTDPPMLLDAGTSGTNASTGLTIIGCYLNYTAATPNTTVAFIQSFAKGPVVMIGNRIEHPNPLINVQAQPVFIGNHWYWEPRIYRSDSLTLFPQSVIQGDFYHFYNGIAGDSVVQAKYIPSKIDGHIEVHAASVPTTGTWVQGAKIWKSDVAAAGSPGWICTASGTFSAATDSTGDTDGSTGIITGMTDTSDFNLFEYVTVSAGFASVPLRIISKTATSITLDTVSNSAQSNVTVATPDPVFNAMANIAA